MTPVPIFRALVTPDARVLFRETERARRREWLHCLAGNEVEVLMRRVPRQRTLDQSRYIHAVPVRMIALHTGDSIPATKRNLMGACWDWTRDLDTGLVRPWMEHTSSMSDEEASYFIDWVAPFALDKFGVEIPLPGEVHF